MIRLEADAGGREVVLVIYDMTDRFDQFLVEVHVDEKKRYSGHFTDKSDDATQHDTTHEDTNVQS